MKKLQYHHFSKILFTEHKCENICKTVISGKEQNLNKQMAEFGSSILLCIWPNSILFQGLEN